MAALVDGFSSYSIEREKTALTRFTRLKQNALSAAAAVIISISTSIIAGKNSFADCPSLTETAPRGLACLQCLHPSAAEQANVIINLLKDTCLKNVAINYLVDGSFGEINDDRGKAALSNQLRLLSDGGRHVHLVLYLLNGPSQRRFKTTPIKGLMTKIDPTQLRKELKSQSTAYSQIGDFVRNQRDLFKSLGESTRLYLVPMLEDNLDDESFIALSELINTELGPEVKYQMVRNPCGQCYPGNGRAIPAGLIQESHTVAPNEVPASGVVTNDGIDISFDGSEGSTPLQSLDTLKAQAERAKAVFILWNAEYQGLNVKNSKIEGNGLTANERKYQLPSPKEAHSLVQFLR